VSLIGEHHTPFCFGIADISSDWFRLETLDDSLQPTIDMLLNLAVFMWYGAVCPWPMFLHNNVVSLPRLIGIGILILLFRRIPIIFAMHKRIPQIEEVRQAIFVGWFGPVGCSAIFYLYISVEFLRDIQVDGVQRPDAAFLQEVITVVVWFLAICSIVSLSSSHPIFLSLKNPQILTSTSTQVVHGLSIPVGKVGFHLPRTISAVMTSDSTSENPQQPFNLRGRVFSRSASRERNRHVSDTLQSPPDQPQRPLYRIGGSVIPNSSRGSSPPFSSSPPLSSSTRVGGVDRAGGRLDTLANRTIKFPDNMNRPPS
jgi:hypothetical protein